jgi:hypothetical protein
MILFDFIGIQEAAENPQEDDFRDGIDTDTEYRNPFFRKRTTRAFFTGGETAFSRRNLNDDTLNHVLINII